jgi:hypothetical protein
VISGHVVTSTPHNFEFQTISHDKVREEMKQMKTSKSSGYDKISVKLLQAAGGAIVLPLTYIFKVQNFYFLNENALKTVSQLLLKIFVIMLSC